MGGHSYSPLMKYRGEECFTFDHAKADAQAEENCRHQVWAGPNFGFAWDKDL